MPVLILLLSGVASFTTGQPRPAAPIELAQGILAAKSQKIPRFCRLA